MEAVSFPAFDAADVEEAFGKYQLASPLARVLAMIDAEPPSREAKLEVAPVLEGDAGATEIARAVAINPAFILLDEPFAGVDPIAVEDIQSIVATLKNKNIGVIITDHNVDETLAITDRAYLLYEGKVLKTGSPEELAADPEVRKRYLGKHFELRRSPTIDRLRQQGAEAQRSVSETDAEATHE